MIKINPINIIEINKIEGEEKKYEAMNGYLFIYTYICK